MSLESVTFAVPYITITISEPARLYLKLSCGSKDANTALSPPNVKDMPLKMHSWTLQAIRFNIPESKIDKASFRVEIWRKWSWPWNDTLQAQGEVVLSKLLKNHCSLPVSDPRRASQAVNIVMDSTKPELLITCNLFPETTSPAHWRTLYDQHTTKLNALRDLLYLFEKSNAKDSMRDDKWSHYCDTATLVVLIDLLRRWSLGTLPNASNSANRVEKARTRADRSYLESISDDSSSEEEDDLAAPDDDEALSPSLPTTHKNHALANMAYQLWKVINTSEILRTKLGPLKLPLTLIDILLDAFDYHPSRAMFVLELLKPYIAARNSITPYLVYPFCSQLFELSKAYISLKFENSAETALLSSDSITNSSSSPSSVDDFESFPESPEAPSATSSRSSLPVKSSHESSGDYELQSIRQKSEDGEVPFDLLVSDVEGSKPPRKSKNNGISTTSDTSSKLSAKLERRKMREKRKEERLRLYELSLRERARVRLLTILFQQLKYFDPIYIPKILESPATDAINTILSADVPSTLAGLGLDALKFIGLSYKEVLDKRRCFEKMRLLLSQTADVNLKFNIVNTLRQFKVSEAAQSEEDVIKLLVDELNASLTVQTTGKSALNVVADPKKSTIAFRFLRFLMDATPGLVQSAFKYDATITFMFSCLTSDDQTLKRAADVIPDDLPASALLKARLPIMLNSWLQEPIKKDDPIMRPMASALQSLIKAPIFAPEFSWLASPDIVLGENGSLPNTSITWSELHEVLETSGLISSLMNKISLPGPSASEFQFVIHLIKLLCESKRPLLDYLVMKKGLISAIFTFLENVTKHAGHDGRRNDVLEIVPALCKMLLDCYRLGMWVNNGVKNSKEFCNVSQDSLKSCPSFGGPKAVESANFIFLFQIVGTKSLNSSQARLAFESGQVWDCLSLLFNCLMSKNPADTKVCDCIATIAEHRGSPALFYRSFLKSAVASLSFLARSTFQNQLDRMIHMISTMLYKSQSNWALISERSPLWLQQEAITSSHTQYVDYMQHYDMMNDFGPVTFETDSDPLWAPFVKSPSSNVNKHSQTSKQSSSSQSESVPSQNPSQTQPSDSIFTEPESCDNPLFVDKVPLGVQSYLSGETTESESKLPKIDFDPKRPLPLRGVLSLSNALIHVLSSGVITRLSDSMLKLFSFLQETDPLFTTRLFELPIFWAELHPSHDDREHRAMGTFIIENLRHPSALQFLSRPANVPTLSSYVLGLIRLGQFSSICLAEVYNLISIWLHSLPCSQALPVPTLDAFAFHLSDSRVPEFLRDQFSLLWFNSPKMSFSGYFSFLPRLCNTHSEDMQNRIYQLYKKRMQTIQEEDIKSFQMPSDVEQVFKNADPKYLSVVMLKIWTLLWRAGNTEMLNTISFAFAPAFRSTQALENTIESSGLSKFMLDITMDQRPEANYKFLNKLRLNKSQSAAPETPTASPISSATNSLNITSNSIESPENHPEIQRWFERTFYQAVFIATVLHESAPVGRTFCLPPALEPHIDPDVWPSRNPLARLLVCAFQPFRRLSKDDYKMAHMNKQYATLFVDYVADNLDFFLDEFPIVILAILQSGVMNSHHKSEHRLYYALFQLYSSCQKEPHRVWRVLDVMVQCAARHPAALCREVPIHQIVLGNTTSMHSGVRKTAWRLFGTVAENMLDQPSALLLETLSAMGMHSANYNISHLVGIQLLHRLTKKDLSDEKIVAMFSPLSSALRKPGPHTHIVTRLTTQWVTRPEMYHKLITAELLVQMREHIEAIPRYLELLFPSIIKNQPESIASFASIAAGKDDLGLITNGSIIGRYLVMLAAFPDAIRKGVLIGPYSTPVEGPTDLLGSAIHHKEWQSFHAIAGLIDMSAAIVIFSEVAKELLGPSQWSAHAKAWSDRILESGKHHPIFDLTAKTMGATGYKFVQNRAYLPVPRVTLKMYSISNQGGVLFAPMNTAYAYIHGKPVHIVIDEPIELETLRQKGYTAFVLSAVPGCNVQIPPYCNIGFATSAAIGKIRANPQRCVGQVHGSYAFCTATGGMHADGNFLNIFEGQTTPRRLEFTMTLSLEHHSLSIKFPSSAGEEMHHFNNIRLSDTLYPVISCENSCCYSFDSAWKRAD